MILFNSNKLTNNYGEHDFLRVGNLTALKQSFYPTCSQMALNKSKNNTQYIKSSNVSDPFPCWKIALILILGFMTICTYIHCKQEQYRNRRIMN